EAQAVAVHRDRERVIALRAAATGVVSDLSFVATPAVILAAFDDVDLFPVLLADVTRPQRPADRVEAPAPWIAQTPRVDLRTAARSCAARVRGKGIVGRNGVLRRRRDIDVDPQDRSEQVIHVLRVILRIATITAVAEPDVQI